MTERPMPSRGMLRELKESFELFLAMARWKFAALPILFLVVGVFEGLGIALFFPLLERLQLGGALTDSGFVGVLYRVLDWLHANSFSGILLVLVSMFVLKFLAVFGQAFAVAYIARNLYRSLAFRLLDGMSRSEYETVYLTTSTGTLANALTRELQVFLAAFSHFASMIAGAVLVAVYFWFALFFDTRVTLVAALVGLVLVLAFRSFIVMSKRESIVVTRAAVEYQGGIVEFMQQYKYLKATNQFSMVRIPIREAIIRLTHARFRLNLIGAFIVAIPEPIATMLVATFLYVSTILWHQPFALVAVLLLLFYRTIMRLMSLQSDWNSFSSASGSLLAIEHLLTTVDRDREQTGGMIPRPLSRGVRLDNVRFAYGEREAIHGVRMWIPKHATVALVGASGGGKSTLVDLMTGVLKPLSGTVSYDDIPYAAVDIEALRLRFGYVAQEISMFRGTILANIIGSDAAPDVVTWNRVGAICAQAQCGTFIEALPQRYATLVGDRGINLSVGQRQRIAIARELYRNPEILIFDEATSALDTESERAIQQSIEALKGSKTLVLIAHRLSTIKHADYIYVIDGGRVIEEGTFDALNGNLSSAFHRMCNLQDLGA